MITGDLLAIDPSICSLGAALFRGGKLIASTCVKLKSDTDKNPAERSVMAADAALEWCTDVGGQPAAVAYEWPQIYRNDTPAKANAVITMASVNACITTGLILAGMVRQRQLVILCYLPAEIWGQLRKSKTDSAIKSPRGKRIVSRLDQEEMRVLTNQHDAVDAIGIGLHSLGRLGVRRALSNGRT